MIHDRQPTHNRYYFALLAANMVFIAFFGDMKGVMAVSIKETLALMDSALSMVFFISSFGYMLFYFVAGKIASRFGYKAGYALGFFLVLVSGLLFSGVESLWQLLVLSFVQGAGFGCLTILSNAIVPVLFPKTAVSHMNLFHLFFALGSAVCKPVIGYALAGGMDWRTLFLIGACGSLVLLPVFLRVKLPGGEGVIVTPDGTPGASKRVSQYMQTRVFWLFILTMGCYLISESLTTNWFVNYAWEGYGVDTSTGANYLFLFFICSTAGKLVFPPLLTRFGHRYLIPAFAVLAGAITLAGVLVGKSGLWLIAGAGLFFSILYPTVLVQVSEAFPGNTSSVLGTMGMIASMLNMLSNLAVGSVNVALGVRVSYLLIPFALFAVAALTLYLGLRRERRLK